MWLNKFQEAYSLLNEFKYRQVTETDREVTYRFNTSKYEYEVAFENTSHGWELIFGVLVDGRIDTRKMVGSPSEIMEVLTTIYKEILRDFIGSHIENEDPLVIIRVPQCLEGESENTNPFERKRGRVSTRIVKDDISSNNFYKRFNVTWEVSKFLPLSILMIVEKIQTHSDDNP
jgi:hypothetical protein